jgi:hypothetical protein
MLVKIQALLSENKKEFSLLFLFPFWLYYDLRPLMLNKNPPRPNVNIAIVHTKQKTEVLFLLKTYCSVIKCQLACTTVLFLLVLL